MARNVFGILLILLGVLVSVFWSYPMWNEITGINAKKEEIRSTLDHINELARRRDGIQDQYNSLSAEDKAKLDEFFPKNQESGLLILNLNNLALSNGMILKKISLTEDGKTVARKQEEDGAEENFSDFPFQISISGSYTSFPSFMKALEKSRRLLDIDRLSFDSAALGADGKVVKSDNYEYSISAHTYWKK